MTKVAKDAKKDDMKKDTRTRERKAPTPPPVQAQTVKKAAKPKATVSGTDKPKAARAPRPKAAKNPTARFFVRVSTKCGCAGGRKPKHMV